MLVTIPLLALFLSVKPLTPPDTSRHFDNPVELDPVLVVGERRPRRLSEVVNSGLTLTTAALEQADEDNVFSLLDDRYAALSISKISNVGFGIGTNSAGQLLIRGLGFSPNRGVLVMIDGRPDIAGLFGHPLPDTYLRAGTRMAGLIKGAASTVYGSNAIGGVLDIESFHRPDLPRYTHVDLEVGSYATHSVSVQHARHVGKFAIAGWYEYIESDNHRDPMWYFNRSGGVRVDLDKVTGFDWFLAGRVSSFDFANPGPVALPSPITGNVVRTGWTLGADRHADEYSLFLRAYSSYGEHSFSDGFNSLDRNNGLDVSIRLHPAELPAVTVAAGGSLNYLGGSAYDGTPFVRSGDFHEYEWAGRLQAEVTPIPGFTLTAGGRLIDHDRYGGHATGQVGAVLSPKNMGSIKMSAATAYRNPTVNESQLFLVSNADSLQPEEGKFYEIGWFRMFGDLLSLEGSYFWRKGDNLIATLPNPSPPPMVRFQNTGTYDHQGYEATIRVKYAGLSIMPTFMHLDQNNYNNSVPDDKLTVRATWSVDRFRFEAETIAAWKTASDSIAVTPQGDLSIPVTLDDYLLVNAGMSAAIYEGISVHVRGDNLLDGSYETVWGYPMPGATVRLGLSARVY